MEETPVAETIPADIPPTGQVAESPDLTSDFLGAVDGIMKGEIDTATSDLLLKVVVPAGLALLMLVVTYFVAKLISRWVASGLCNRVDQTLGRFAGKFSFYAIFSVAGLAVLQTAGVSITSFAALMAAAGFAIGLAFQGTLSNFASGILLLVFRPFKVGDFVNAAGIAGKVAEIDLFTTVLDTPDNRRLIVPNSSIAGTTIENVTFHKHRRVDVLVGVAYAASLDRTREALTCAAQALGDKLVTGEGRGHQILLTNLGASSVEWTVRAWAKSKDFFAVKEQLTANIKEQLGAAGLEIPFPQMQLHITRTGADDALQIVNLEHPEKATPKAALEIGENRNGRIRPRIRGESAGT